MGSLAEQIKINDQETTSKKGDLFKNRESSEIVLAFSGPVGCGISHVISETITCLGQLNYEIEHIKISDIIKIIGRKNNLDVNYDEADFYDRYKTLQNAGNNLRKIFQNDILSKIVISRIALERQLERQDKSSNNNKNDNPKRKAYILDQLKHPEEVKILRKVYGNLFYMIGVLACEEKRKNNLKNQGLDDANAEKVMQRDKSEDFEHGQKLERTLKLSDLFITNNHTNTTEISRNIDRFLKLIHGDNSITPTQHEYGMYIAYAAGLKSACLSRQVGASITDPDGNIIATGCNDVPKAGGGLYSADDGMKDKRCINLPGAICYNDKNKHDLLDKIRRIIKKSKTTESIADSIIQGIKEKSYLDKLGTQAKELFIKDLHRIIIEANLSEEKLSQLIEAIKLDSGLKDLIEFSRSVHAEMDAIISVARNGGKPLQNSYLYTTTFPCHGCARQLIAAGIKKVFYIEPYEKSLALDLHGDAVVLDPEETEYKERIIFKHFEGISPRQYQNFFIVIGERKVDGKAIKYNPTSLPTKAMPEYLDDYREFETRVFANLKDTKTVDDDVLREIGINLT